MKYALIGCGRISTNHVKAVVNNKMFLQNMDLKMIQVLKDIQTTKK